MRNQLASAARHDRSRLTSIAAIALVVGAALLTVHHTRIGNDLVAAGFLVFVVGEGLIVSASAMDLVASVPVFGAGTGLWAAAILLVSASTVTGLRRTARERPVQRPAPL